MSWNFAEIARRFGLLELLQEIKSIRSLDSHQLDVLNQIRDSMRQQVHDAGLGFIQIQGSKFLSDGINTKLKRRIDWSQGRGFHIDNPGDEIEIIITPETDLKGVSWSLYSISPILVVTNVMCGSMCVFSGMARSGGVFDVPIGNLVRFRIKRL